MIFKCKNGYLKDFGPTLDWTGEAAAFALGDAWKTTDQHNNLTTKTQVDFIKLHRFFHHQLLTLGEPGFAAASRCFLLSFLDGFGALDAFTGAICTSFGFGLGTKQKIIGPTIPNTSK